MSLIMPQIKNKQRRGEVYKQYLKEKRKVKMEEKKTRKKEEKQMGSKAPPKKKPKTLENMRVPDETMVDPTNQETVIDLEQDEMAPYFRQETTPKILITTSDRPKHKTNRFIKELKKVIPNSVVKYRRGLDLKKIIPQAISRDFTDLIIINEDAGEPNILF
ncbi:Ribosome production factor 1 [Bulinus truncatus]|nr:Ribosome production factor 1 [Bulinus truncatus]